MKRGRKNGLSRGEEAAEKLEREFPGLVERITLSPAMKFSTGCADLDQMLRFFDPVLVSWILQEVERTIATGDSTTLERFALACGAVGKEAREKREGSGSVALDLWIIALRAWYGTEGRLADHVPLPLAEIHRLVNGGLEWRDADGNLKAGPLPACRCAKSTLIASLRKANVSYGNAAPKPASQG